MTITHLVYSAGLVTSKSNMLQLLPPKSNYTVSQKNRTPDET